MRKKESYEKLFSRFLQNNEELVTQYNIQFGENLDRLKYEIKEAYDYIAIYTNNSLKKVLEQSILKAISNNIPIIDVLNNIKMEISINNRDCNSMQKYFNDINEIYQKNNNDYNIEYNQDNREKLIAMNLKSVISIAKNYQNLGVSLEDLISAGNVGLVIAFDKYNPKRSKLKDNIVECIKSINKEDITYDDICQSIQSYLTYGDVKQAISLKFNNNKLYKKKDVLKWVNQHIQNAKFSSVAAMWIKAYIIQEIYKHGRIVRKPRKELQNDKTNEEKIKKEYILSIDTTLNDNNKTLSDILYIESEDVTDLDIYEATYTFRDILDKLLDGVTSRDRRIILKRFGIGLPRPMNPREIAEQERLSVARVSQIFQNVIIQMQDNKDKFNIDSNFVYDIVSKVF